MVGLLKQKRIERSNVRREMRAIEAEAKAKAKAEAEAEADATAKAAAEKWAFEKASNKSYEDLFKAKYEAKREAEAKEKAKSAAETAEARAKTIYESRLPAVCNVSWCPYIRKEQQCCQVVVNRYYTVNQCQSAIDSLK